MSDFDYHLPEELIAQVPLPDRHGSRMLHLDRVSGKIEHGRFRDFPQMLRPDDLIVFNNTRVFPARLLGTKDESGSMASPPRRVEVLLTRQLSWAPNEWECLVRPGRKVAEGDLLSFSSKDGVAIELRARVVRGGPHGERRLRFDHVQDFHGTLERLGHIPLPPYIHREDHESDRGRYQTVYARERGSVAAPTAGLHFTAEILAEINKRGIETAEVTLHVGLGTFQPIRGEQVEEHKLHGERYEISTKAAASLNAARVAGRRIIAIGTTTVRTLEFSARALSDQEIVPGSGEADIFIYPGYEFRVVNGMLTNFHLPQSTLLMLVSAFAGRERVLRAYQEAVEQHYRFYSYGDCMLVD